VRIVFDAELWPWDARRADAWTFVSLPASESEEIRDLAGGLRRGFGSVRVRATIGGSTWTTSIFPGKAGYVLPVKRPVRVAEALDAGDTATVKVELIGIAHGDGKTVGWLAQRSPSGARLPVHSGLHAFASVQRFHGPRVSARLRAEPLVGERQPVLLYAGPARQVTLPASNPTAAQLKLSKAQ
jgi:Domain of unknown function (DUF1905)